MQNHMQAQWVCLREENNTMYNKSDHQDNNHNLAYDELPPNYFSFKESLVHKI